MDAISSLLEAIFGNMFILIAIVVGIIGFFKNGSDNKGDHQSPNQSRPTSTPSGRTNLPSQRTTTNSNTQHGTVDTSSIDDQHQSQLDQLADRYATAKRSAENISNHQHRTSPLKEERGNKEEQLSSSQKKFKKQINRNLTKQGLANGIIMAEILGPPRAKKPYRNVISERK
ncbi:hypothetical protein [Oceanobacillus manasiensis]|uniref:hypothetical protein n=1 Tax=Oceanobacillus manasiensis TaxID=586413 RepID=UPI0005A8951A|nr:hypothetical protein [Oceanobacillus manasiensis]